MKKNILISIIISTRNKSWETISKSMDSILSSNFKDFEIILIDQNDSEEIRLKIKSKEKYNNILYFKSEEVGLSRGRNFGIRKSKGDWLLFFDDDALLPEGFFEKIEEQLKQSKEKVFYGKVLNFEDGSSYIKRRVQTPYLHLWNFDSVCSIGLLFNKKVVENVGFFDESFGAGGKFGAGEEGDYIIRALRERHKIKYLDDFVVYHPKAEPNLEKKYSYGYGLGALYKKHIFDSFGFFLVLGAKLIGEIILRIGLGILFLFIDSQKSKLHINYLKGFINGFLSYESCKLNKDAS